MAGILVIGGDSMIGRAFSRACREQDVPVLETTRRSDDGTQLFFDLAQGNPPELGSAEISAVLLCAGITPLGACEAAPAATRQLNVDRTLAVASYYAGKGVHVVGFSTNLVYDGTVERRQAEDPVSPQTEYGRQKTDLEAGFAGLGDQGTIVRLTKVLSYDWPLFRKWAQQMRDGLEIQPYIDMKMAPIFVEEVAQTLLRLVRDRRPGLFQLSAISDISYTVAAGLLCQKLGTDPDLVCPVVPPPQIDKHWCPPYTSLDTSRAVAELGWRPVESIQAITKIMDHEQDAH